jgi:hypothetical protein
VSEEFDLVVSTDGLITSSEVESVFFIPPPSTFFFDLQLLEDPQCLVQH